MAEIRRHLFLLILAAGAGGCAHEFRRDLLSLDLDSETRPVMLSRVGAQGPGRPIRGESEFGDTRFTYGGGPLVGTEIRFIDFSPAGASEQLRSGLSGDVGWVQMHDVLFEGFEQDAPGLHRARRKLRLEASVHP